MAVLEGSGDESAAEVFSGTRNYQVDSERYSLREEEKTGLTKPTSLQGFAFYPV